MKELSKNLSVSDNFTRSGHIELEMVTYTTNGTLTTTHLWLSKQEADALISHLENAFQEDAQ